MTIKHFRAIIALVRSQQPHLPKRLYEALAKDAATMCHAQAKSPAAFDRSYFLSACGLTSQQV